MECKTPNCDLEISTMLMKQAQSSRRNAEYFGKVGIILSCFCRVDIEGFFYFCFLLSALQKCISVLRYIDSGFIINLAHYGYRIEKKNNTVILLWALTPCD